MAAVVAMIHGRAERARVAGALHGVAAVQFCERVSELAEAVSATRVRAVVTELRDCAGTTTAPLIRTIRVQRPSVKVIVYLELSAPDVRELVTIATAVGISGVIFHSMDDLGTALRSTLRGVASGSVPAAEVLGAVGSLVPPRLLPFFAFCINGAVEPIMVADAAAALGVPRRTLVERLHRAGLPGPSRIIGWCRLLHAALQLEESQNPLEQISETLGFASASAFHNQLRRYTGLSVAAIRKRGGFATVLAAFTGELGGDDRSEVTGAAGRW